MTISYKKLWIMLAEHEMSKVELRRRAELSPATFTKLRRNQSVSMEVLLKIAEVMDCNIGDMMDFIKIPEPEEK
jgi:DNA-binding Xre family transcriptional regulator